MMVEVSRLIRPNSRVFTTLINLLVQNTMTKKSNIRLMYEFRNIVRISTRGVKVDQRFPFGIRFLRKSVLY